MGHNSQSLILTFVFLSRNQDEERANFNLNMTDSEELCKRVSNSVCESSVSSARNHESSSNTQGDLYKLEMKHIVDNESEDSDSEIFRVKRPSSLMAERRNGNDGMSSKHSNHQVLSIFHPFNVH